MDNDANVDNISTTELLMIIGAGLIWMDWVVGAAFILVPMAQLLWNDHTASVQGSRQEKTDYPSGAEWIVAA